MLTKQFEKGFTLIEAMITMLIVSIGLLAMASLLITAIKVNQDSEMRLDASTKAESIANYATAQVRSAVVTQATLQAYADTTVQSPFTATVLLQQSTPVNCGYHDITVTVTWTLRNAPKSVTVETGAMTNTGGC